MTDLTEKNSKIIDITTEYNNLHITSIDCLNTEITCLLKYFDVIHRQFSQQHEDCRVIFYIFFSK